MSFIFFSSDTREIRDVKTQILFFFFFLNEGGRMNAFSLGGLGLSRLFPRRGYHMILFTLRN